MAIEPEAAGLARLLLEQVGNARDIGGVLTVSGRRVATGRLYRSASPHEMTRDDAATLDRLKVHTIIDLRTAGERERQPYELATANILSIPLANEDVVTAVTERFQVGSLTSAELEDWWTLVGVSSAPETQVPGIRAIFNAVLDLPEGEAALIHCRTGKDRTGLVAALILAGLGVERDDILQDFLLSSNDPHQPPHETAAVRAAIENLQLTPEAAESLTGVRPEWLISVLDGIEGRYGSVVEYLSGRIGLGTEGVDRLRARFLIADAT